MKALVFVCLVIMAIANKENVMLQKPDLKAFEEIFQVLAQDQSEGDFGFDLFSQLKEKIQAGGDISDIHDHILVLKNHLESDQENDKDFYNNESGKLNTQINTLNNQINDLQEEEAFLEEKLSVLNSQSNTIDTLFAADSEAYATRVGTQNAMLDTLDLLTKKIQQNLVDGQSLLQTTDLFDELKKIGRGKHVEVLAQLTAHLDQDQVERVLELFTQLQAAIQESVSADEVKEQENIKLHNSLREEIGRLIPETDTKLGETLDQIDDKNLQKEQAKERLSQVTQAYQERLDHRNVALSKTSDAKQLLEDNVERLARWEQLVDQAPH